MKKVFTKALAVFLSVLILVGSAPLDGLVGLDLSEIKNIFSMKAGAATSGDYEYYVSNGKATIKKYKGSGGDVTIPSNWTDIR